MRSFLGCCELRTAVIVIAIFDIVSITIVDYFQHFLFQKKVFDLFF